jgi:hypothetical protein
MKHIAQIILTMWTLLACSILLSIVLAVIIK